MMSLPIIAGSIAEWIPLPQPPAVRKGGAYFEFMIAVSALKSIPGVLDLLFVK